MSKEKKQRHELKALQYVAALMRRNNEKLEKLDKKFDEQWKAGYQPSTNSHPQWPK